jgi:Mce-associated membrane protein
LQRTVNEGHFGEHRGHLTVGSSSTSTTTAKTAAQLRAAVKASASEALRGTQSTNGSQVAAPPEFEDVHEPAGDEATEIQESGPSAEVIEIAEATDGTDSASASRSSGRRWASRLVGRLASPVVSVCLVVALIIAGILLGFSRMSLGDKDAVTSSRTDALAASKAYSVELASYDYHHLDQDFGKVLADSTPAFRQTFTQSSAALKTILTRYNATATADVIAAGLVSGSTNRAVALVFLNQTVTNTTQKKGQPSTTQSRVEITLVHQHGRWLIDQVSLL